MFHHLFARPILATFLAVAAITIGCDKSPSGPTTSPPVTPPSAPLTVTAVSPDSGPTTFASEISVTGSGFRLGATLTLDGVAAKVTGITSTAITALTPVHTAGTVDVVVTNPGGPSTTLTGGYTFEVVFISLTASPSFVKSGDQLTVSWVGPSGRGCNGGGDWIAIYKVGDPDVSGAANGHSDLWFVHVCGATSGTSTLSAPLQPGEYEFRFMMGDTAVARSSPVTVSASSSPPPLAPTLSVDGATESSRKVGETFWVTGIGYTPGRIVTRYLDSPMKGVTAITPLTADRFGNLSWAFTPTCGDFNPIVGIYAVDDATGRTSNTITETVTGSCP
jgi:IPT/TIG domain-containing protein